MKTYSETLDSSIKKYIICKNKSDFAGYNNQLVVIVNSVSNNRYRVSDGWGNFWTVNDDELQELC